MPISPNRPIAPRSGCLLTMLVLSLALGPLATAARSSELVLQSGWSNGSAAEAAEGFVDDGIVHLKGFLQFGSTDVLFTLPPTMRPATDVYVSIDMGQIKAARLRIRPDGVTFLQNALPFDPQYYAFVSLDGARFAPSAAGFTSLTLLNGWTGGPFATSAPAARLIDGIVHLKGAAASGTNGVLFTLPVGMRPEATVYLEVSLCTAASGTLMIQPDGTATVSADNGNFGSAQCFTSLDGVSFAPSSSGFTPVALASGWTNAPGATSPAAVSMVDGIVRFKGAVASNGTTLNGFQLPPAMWPAANISVPIDDCNNGKAFLFIQSNGQVSVQFGYIVAPTTCRASLDGASFVAPPPIDFTDLPLASGWSNGLYATVNAAVAYHGGVTYFRGAVTGAPTAGATLFTLPVALRPDTNAYVSTDLCLARQGRLLIEPNGAVSVQTDASASLADAQCFTSLEGVKSTRYATGFTPLALVNGWSDQAYGTSRASAARIDGIVHLKGAVYGGTGDLVFTLPPELRPDVDVFLPINLCSATKGRLFIAPNGEARVVDPTTTAAQCFVSLDGVSFTTSPPSPTTLVPMNGWTVTPYGTAAPSAKILRNIVHLRGALIGGASPGLFTLPPGLRPPGRVYVPVDLVNGRKGRLTIESTGLVSVTALTNFSDAQAFTSLDGVTFAVPEPGLVPALAAGLLMLGARGRARRRAA